MLLTRRLVSRPSVGEVVSIPKPVHVTFTRHRWHPIRVMASQAGAGDEHWVLWSVAALQLAASCRHCSPETSSVCRQGVMHGRER